MASIRIERVSKRYGAVEAVRDLSLFCADGELLALLGPSGCGKTSTLKMLAGIEDVTEGMIYFGDRPVTALDAAERNVAMVFEDYALYPHLTVAQNIAFPLEIRGRPRDEIRRATEGAMALLGLEASRDTNVRQLSGGAQQRVGIGRALVRQPAVILFDEPLSHLDGTQKSQLRAEIKRLQSARRPLRSRGRAGGVQEALQLRPRAREDAPADARHREFFTRKKGEKLTGETLESDFYGVVLEGIKGGTTLWTVLNAFVKNFGGDIFDAEGRPTVNRPENVAGVKFWADLWKFSPPGQAEYSLIDVPTVMGNGIAASGRASSGTSCGRSSWPGSVPRSLS